LLKLGDLVHRSAGCAAMLFVALGVAGIHSVAAAASGSSACGGGIAKGAFAINGMESAYLAGDGGNADGDRLTLRHNAGLSVLTSCEQDWKPDAIAQFKLLGKAITFTVDLSNVGCACNLAFYLISMPARDSSGKYNQGSDRQGQPPYYCDANMVGGQWCPEIDIMEANNHAFQSTPHSCETPMNGHYSNCDRVGCSQNTRNAPDAYGPGTEFRIDTTRTFDVRTDFFQNDGMLTGMRTTLSQEGRSFVLKHLTCDADYLAKLTDAMSDGMSLRITYWGRSASTMAWLDAPPCHSEACTGSNAGEAVLRNITVSKAADLPDDSTSTESGEGHQKWIADPWAKWECHHYVGNQQATNWCKRAGIEGGFEYKYTGGEGAQCGPCWCCKRKAKLAPGGATAPAVTWNSPEPAVTTTMAVTTKPPPLTKGALDIRGVDSSYVAGTAGSVEGGALTIRHNAGFTIFTERAQTWEPDNIEEFKLLGKIISYTVDLSKVGCACNLAFYLIAMPARDMQGEPSPGTNRQGQPPYYCDANMVGGQWCPEIDIMEANNHAFQATLHRCDPAVHKHYTYCDRGGCEQTTRTKSDAYGPGSQYNIDTTHPFEVETEFLKNDGVLSGMRTVLRQEGRHETMEHSNCNKAYLAKLSAVMSAGMSLRITYWGGEAQTMAWMDVPPCGGAGCQGSNAGPAVISNLEIKRGGSVDRELVWVVWDPKDDLYGTIAPRSVVADTDKFASMGVEGIATWDGARHFLRQLPRSSVMTRLKEAMAAGRGAETVTTDCDDPDSPCDVSVRRESSYFNSLLAKYSPLATPLSASDMWPLHILLLLGTALLVGGAALLFVRRRSKPNRAGNVTPPKRESGSQAAFARASPSRPTSSSSPAMPKTPPQQESQALPKVLPMPGGEGPSPMRRSRSSQMMSPPRMGTASSRQELLSLLESAAE